MKQYKEKPIIRVTVWDCDNYPKTYAQKDFRTFKAAENYAKKWGMREDINCDPEMSWNEAAMKLLEKPSKK